MIKNIEDVKPLHGLVALREYFLDSGESRIIVPGTANISSLIYEIVAVGPGSLLLNGDRAKMLVEPGDLVMVGDLQHGQAWVVPLKDGKSLKICPEQNLVAKVGHVATSPGSHEAPRIDLAEGIRLQ